MREFKLAPESEHFGRGARPPNMEKGAKLKCLSQSCFHNTVGRELASW